MVTTTKLDRAIEYALWANGVQRLCLLESDGDVDAALNAAEHIVDNETPESFTLSLFKDDLIPLKGPHDAPPGPPFIGAAGDYPRDKSNRFLDKRQIARAAREQNELNKLRDSIPESEQTKLDTVVSHLQGGGTLAKPNENPKVGVNLLGYIPDPVWDSYEWSVKHREEWEERDADRKERAKAAKEALRTMRKKDPDLGESDTHLRRAGAMDAELRSLSRARARSKRDGADEYELMDAYEDVAEAVQSRLEQEIKEDPEPSIPEVPSDDINAPFGMVGDEWHGPTPPGQGWVPSADGPKGGKRWRRSGSGQPQSAQPVKGRGTSGLPDNRGAGSGNAARDGLASRRVGSQAPRPSGTEVDTGRKVAPKPTGDQTTRDAQSQEKSTSTAAKRYRRVEKYEDFFGKRGDKEVAEWMSLLKDHIKKVGKEVAGKQLREERVGTASDEKVQYMSTAYFESGDYDLEWLKDYLNHVGIVFQPGTERIEGLKTVATAPMPSARDGMRPDDLVGTETNLVNKLMEAQALPGLESSEDIHEIMGREVTQFTPDVLKELDSRYGRGKWIVKPYGDEAYAGFGVFFPHRVTEIQRSSKEVLWGVNKRLRPMGYSLARDENGAVVGISDRNDNTYKFGTLELASIRDKKVRQEANIAAAAAPSERGARLPMTPVQGIAQDYGILLRQDEDGKVIGITDGDGRNLDVGTRTYNSVVYDEYSGIGTAIERAITSLEAGEAGDKRFMVQPAFQAVGVSQAERAMGLTWESSTEGRVHVATRNGKAQVIPYATMAYRGDSFPVVFYDKDTLAMEKAVQDAIDALPESERAGQTYAPDVLKTKDGWKVIELNASTESGQSLWFEENPFVIDSYLSLMNNRDPAHVRFIRDIVRDGMLTQKIGSTTTDTSTPPVKSPVLRGKVGVQLSTDDEGHEHAAAGSGKGGQFVSQGGGGTSVETKVEKRDRRDKQKEAKKSTALKVGEAVRRVATVVTKTAGELVTGKPQRISAEQHRKIIKKALAKFAINPKPTEEEVKHNLEGLERLGANKFRRGLVGNSTDRRARRIKLVKEFGDGTSCPCIYCGIIVTHGGSLEQDKMYTTAQGGRYRQHNIVPACESCNKDRGDMPFEEAIKKVVSFVRPEVADAIEPEDE